MYLSFFISFYLSQSWELRHRLMLTELEREIEREWRLEALPQALRVF